jgi:preprotein translocase subunit YajC
VGGVAWAQTGAAGGPPAWLQLVPFLLAGVIFYVLLIRPEQKRRREHERLVAELKRNDQIVLSAGIHGRVAAVGDKTVTVEIARGVQVQVDRSAVQQVARVAAADAREKEREKEKS